MARRRRSATRWALAPPTIRIKLPITPRWQGCVARELPQARCGCQKDARGGHGRKRPPPRALGIEREILEACVTGPLERASREARGEGAAAGLALAVAILPMVCASDCGMEHPGDVLASSRPSSSFGVLWQQLMEQEPRPPYLLGTSAWPAASLTPRTD